MEELMRAPDRLDRDDRPCLLVIKNGYGTDVTIGRATGCLSKPGVKQTIGLTILLDVPPSSTLLTDSYSQLSFQMMVETDQAFVMAN